MSGNSELHVLFVNGINTEFGGSGAEAKKTWEASFREQGVSYRLFATVPRFGLAHKSRWYFLLLALYFLPGTLFRALTSPIFEFAYKLSPWVVLRFLWSQAALRPRRIIFSHHACFYLSLFTARARRVFLIHDLMYVRARSRGASRRMQRLCLGIELLIYRFAPTLLVQSYHEWRLLRRFLARRIHLISCCGLQLTTPLPQWERGLAVISDWRRPENAHGVSRFFSSPAATTYNGAELRFRFFGFGSRQLVERLAAARLSPRIGIADGGVFKDLSDIAEGYFFVPIYHGAGIKRKTLEALSAGRMVIGTKAAFIGLPAWIIAGVTWRVTSIEDLQLLPGLPDAQAFGRALGELSRLFRGIGEVPELCEAPPSRLNG